MPKRGSKAPNTPRGTKRSRREKTRSRTLTTVLGLILTAVGALGVVELRPQLGATPGEALEFGRPFTTPFEVTNIGYLSLHVEHITVIEHRVEAGPITITDGNVNGRDWDNFDLARGETKTIIQNFVNLTPKKADLIIAVDYKYFGFPGRWYRRFVGIYMDNWRWAKQPMDDLKPAMDKIVNFSVKKHAEALARPN